MLAIAHIRANRDEVIAALKKRAIDPTQQIDQVIAIDEERRATQVELDQNLSEAKRISAEIGLLFKSGKQEEAQAAKAKTGELKANNQALDAKLKELERALTEALSAIPNTPHSSVAAGKDSNDNVEIRHHGSAHTNPHATPHWELTERFKLIDFETGVKVSGAGFPIYTGKGAKLQRALIQFFLDEAEKAGYNEVIPPLVINAESGFGTGQLPDKDGQMYHATADDLFLIPTAEVPITNMYRDMIVDEAELPIKTAGYTPCFRREAGSYGKEVRGLNRLHQFDKVEIVQIERPEQSYETLEHMVSYVESLLQKLELPYRVLQLCGGDMGFTAALTYDLEIFSAGQERWLEVSSVSNFETYQSNRMKLRIKGSDGKKYQAHTLNGSALALPRIVAGLLENNFEGDRIVIPKALVPYTKFETIQA